MRLQTYGTKTANKEQDNDALEAIEQQEEWHIGPRHYPA